MPAILSTVFCAVELDIVTTSFGRCFPLTQGRCCILLQGYQGLDEIFSLDIALISLGARSVCRV